MADLPDADPGADTHAAALGERMIARARRLMIVSGLTTLVAIAAVVGAIGYRVFRGGESGAAVPLERIVTLPKGARVTATAAAEDRVVITIDVGGATEIRTYDARTLKEAGRIRFATEP